ncbi:PREDICTED: uncharacterized protein LOC104743414 [Camelina sativa]|uniref:Uncharacterized protein LOC104743414 n=1 Tax=Camelina sativa TaxID=90675 RepID=A0ABM0VXZ4_CAMSA|nr:PREDICTED: uncharacterized protein LOC104743414 [Camelina sativa]
MASSSRNNFDDMLDDSIDQLCNQISNQINDQITNQVYQNLTIPPGARQKAPISKKKRAFIERRREEGHTLLWNDYFSENATYPPLLFRRRFRMNKPLFMRITDRLSNEIPYFQQRRDATGRFGLSALQKCTAAIRMMAYGFAADALDEYLRLSETTAIQCLENFVEGVINLFGDEYLRRPTQRIFNVYSILESYEDFPG